MKYIRYVVLSLLTLLPAVSLAQTPRRGAEPMPQGALAQGMQHILEQLNLSDEQKTKTNDIMKQTQVDVRDAMQEMRDADPQQRRAKAQEIQKMMTEGRDKIEAVLTPEQKKKFYPLNANMLVERAQGTLIAVRTGADKLEIDDSARSQLKAILDDTGKTLDGYKTDAEAISTPAAETDLQQKLLKTQMDLSKQLRDTLGAEDARQLMQAARQASQNGGAGRKFLRQPVPSTKP